MHGWVRTRMNASLRFSLNCGAHFTWNRRYLGVEVVDVNSRIAESAPRHESAKSPWKASVRSGAKVLVLLAALIWTPRRLSTSA